jgi:hypothetical protein
MMDPTTELIRHIDALTVQMEKRNSLWYTLLWGVFYGVGFVIGSVVLATILIGIFLPFVRTIPGIQQAFQSGVGVIQQSSTSTTTTH